MNIFSSLRTASRCRYLSQTNLLLNSSQCKEYQRSLSLPVLFCACQRSLHQLVLLCICQRSLQLLVPLFVCLRSLYLLGPCLSPLEGRRVPSSHLPPLESPRDHLSCLLHPLEGPRNLLYSRPPDQLFTQWASGAEPFWTIVLMAYGSTLEPSVNCSVSSCVSRGLSVFTFWVLSYSSTQLTPLAVRSC